MKKLIFVYLIALFFITGCDKEKNNQRLITNNYNAISAPIFIPNNKPTIKQKIIINSLTDNKVTHMIIESNADGLIEKILTDDESENISVDYNKKTNYYSGIDAKLELDHNNNITAILDKNNERLGSLSYNKLGQFTKLEDVNPFTKEGRVQVFGYYDNKTVTYVVSRKKFSYLVKFFYNKKGEMIESIAENYIITDDKSTKPDLNIKQSDRKSENLKPSAFKCIYLNHNEYGDWTKAYCMTGDEVRSRTYIRELEY